MFTPERKVITYFQWENAVKRVFESNICPLKPEIVVPWHLLYDDYGLNVTVNDIIVFVGKYAPGLEEFLELVKYSPNYKRLFKPGYTLIKA